MAKLGTQEVHRLTAGPQESLQRKFDSLRGDVVGNLGFHAGDPDLIAEIARRAEIFVGIAPQRERLRPRRLVVAGERQGNELPLHIASLLHYWAAERQ